MVRFTELRGSAEPPNLTEPSSSAEPEPERFGRSLLYDFIFTVMFDGRFTLILTDIP